MNARGKGRYVDALKVNGKAIGRTWLGHDELMKGATLDFSMSAKPNMVRGTREQDVPYSFSRDEKH